MGIRFRKSIKIAPGIRLNLSKSGISTTVGVRGLSVNTGRRGTYVNAAIPGTGISSRTRVGAGGRARSGAPRGRGGSGAAGYWMVGGLVLSLGIALAGGGRQPAGMSEAVVAQLPPMPYPSQADYDTLYLHGSVPIRSAPNRRAPLVRMLHRGDRVVVGKKDPSGWAAVSEPEAGYIYRASKLVRTSEPAVSRQRTARSADGGDGDAQSRRPRRTAPAARASSGYYLGPRGGCYTYSASGRKRYVDRSYCS